MMERVRNYFRKAAARAHHKSRVKENHTLVISDFSAVEDSEDAFTIIRDIAADAGHNAAMEAKAAGLDVVYIRNFKDLIRISPSGIEIVITPKYNQASFYIKYKPSTVLHAITK